MRYRLLFVLMCVGFFACKKDNADKLIIEPGEEKLLQSDTIQNGSFWNIHIGMLSSEVYNSIRNISAEKQISSVWVTGNVYTDLASIKDKIPLYRSLYFDETTGTESGIQLSFENDKVKSIFKNSGQPVFMWPLGFSNTKSIRQGISQNTVFERLENIHQISSYTAKFQRLSLFDKDLLKAYDPGMNNSKQWYIGTPIIDGKWHRISLNFEAGVLTSMYVYLYEYYG